MAEAVFFNLPFYGHMNPTLSLVAELTRRGERITYYSSETFRTAIERAGAAFRGIDAFMNERTPVDENLVRFASILIHTAQEALPTLLAETSASQPDYVIYDSLCIWGRCVAESLRLPAVASISTLARPHSSLQREVLAGALSILPSSISMLINGRHELQAFNAISKQLQQTYHCSRIGLSDAYNNLAELNIVYSISELQSWPNSFDDRFKFVGPFLGDRGAAPAFPFEELGHDPVIYISLGTVFNAKADFYHLCFEAFADSAYRVVLAIGDKFDPHLLGEIPANFIVRPAVPQLEILRRAALFITHGGMNSVNEGLAADVPLLVIPQGADQFLIARRIQRLRAGKTLRGETLSAEGLRDAAWTILTDPAYRQRSARLGASLRTAGGPPAAADAIAEYKRTLGL
jgi:MGT family glycosyltransferase